MSRQFNNEPFSTVNDLTNSDNCESHIFLLVSYEHIGSLKESVSSNYTPSIRNHHRKPYCGKKPNGKWNNCALFNYIKTDNSPLV